jgi:hypothetical protein
MFLHIKCGMDARILRKASALPGFFVGLDSSGITLYYNHVQRPKRMHLVREIPFLLEIDETNESRILSDTGMESLHFVQSCTCLSVR